MASTNSPQSLVGDFKNLFKDAGLVEAIPTWAITIDRYKFEEAYSTGQYYIFGVVLQKENGATYAPSSGVNSGPQTMNPSIAGYVAQVQVEGYSIYMRSRLSYDAAAKASRAGKKAFAQAYGAILKNLKESHQYRLELSTLYGRDGLGIVSANNAGVLTITAATWSTGTWAAGLKDAVLEAFTGVAGSVTQHDGDLTITAVSAPNKTVTVTGTNSSVVPGDVLYFKGARTTTGWNEAPGLYRILTNTGSLFNVDAAVYDNWKSQLYPVNGNLSMTAIMQASALGMSYGLEKAVLLTAPPKFAQLGVDEAALRRYVSESDALRTNRGVRGVDFTMGPVSVEVLAHPFVREGSAMMLPDDQVHRIGATDVTMALPGTNEPLSVQVTDVTAIEIRSMSDVGVFMDKPAQGVLLTAIS